jgi:hypothetical protein
MRSVMTVTREPLFLLGLWLLVGCGSGGGCGGGCAGLVPTEGFEEKDKIEIAGQLRVTSSGLSFLEENLEPILESVLPSEGLNFCIPGDGGDIIGLVRWGFCQSEVCPDGQLGCALNLGIDSVGIGLAEPSEVQATVLLSELSVRIPVSANPFVDCSISIDGDGFELMLPIDLSTPEPNRYLAIDLAGQPIYQLSDLSIRLRSEGGGLSFLCDAIDGVINLPFIGDLIFDAIQGLVDGLLYEQLAGLFEGFTCKSCDVLSDCQDYSATSCTDGVCRMDSGECVVAPLGLEGQIDLASILGGLLMTPSAPVDLLAVPGSFVEVEAEGLSMGLIAGFRSPRDRCVPPVPPTEILEQDPSMMLRGGMDGQEEAFQLGFGLTRSALDRFMWSFYNTGGLCIQVTGDTISQLNTSLLGVIFPDLASLARNPRAPVAITLSPQNPPKTTFGTNTVEFDEDGSPLVTDPLLSLFIESLWLDFHVFMDDRWVRFASLHTNVDLPFAIDFTPDNKLIPLLGDLSQALQDLRIENTDLLRGDSSLVVTLLPMLINVFAGGLVTDLIAPIELPAFLGFELDLEGTQFTGIEQGEMLAVFTSLRAQQQMLISSVETEAELLDVHMPDYTTLPQFGLDAWTHIWVDVDTNIWDSGVVPSEMEVSYQVDGFGWSPFQPAGIIRVRSPQFLLQGKHTLNFRGRRVGNYLSMDSTGAELEIILDNVKPTVSVERFETTANLTVSDLVSDAADLIVNVRGPSGAIELADTLSFETRLPGTYLVTAVDEAGNVGTTQVEVAQAPLIGRAAPAARGDGGCGCNQSTTPPLMPVFLLLLVAGLIRGQRPLLWLGFLICVLGVLGCEDDAGALKDRDIPDMGPRLGCVDDTECAADNHQCIDGLCGVIDCQSHSECDGLACDEGSALCTPEGQCECLPDCDGGCADDEFCCQQTSECQSLIEGCDMACAPGFERTSSLLSTDSFTCVTPEQNCDCVELAPLESGLIGRFAALATDGQQLFVSAYDERYGDLVVGTASDDDSVNWMWVDGVPMGAPVVAGPSGPRGGVESPGADVGRYTAIAVDASGHVHVAYYGSNPGTLYYALGQAEPDGTYRWSTLRLDEAGDAGRWASISLDSDGRPGIAYHVRYLNGLSQLRYVFASVALPTQRADWTTPFLLQARSIEMPGEQALETYPDGTGLFTSQARDSEGFPVVAWYDRSEGKLWTTRFSEAGFLRPTMVAGWGHTEPSLDGDMGANVHVALDQNDALHFCFQDGNTDSLRYLSPTLDLNEWIDDGVWIDTGGRGQALHVVGDDCQVLFDSDDSPLVIYQDATQQALLMRRRNRATVDGALGWSGRVGLRADLGSTPRGYGFYASGVVLNDELWVGHLVYDRDEASEGYYEILKVEL